MHAKAHSSNQVDYLPEKHFAILFEGAWIFRQPEDKPHTILATCPIVAQDHVGEFGIWNGKDLDPVPPLKSICMMLGSTVSVQVTGVDDPATSFTEAFDRAAEKYPFVYMRSTVKPSDGGKDLTFTMPSTPDSDSLRTVLIPVPTHVRVAGALVTAEVKGNHKKYLVGGEVTAKRAFVTYLFIYKYSDSLEAQVCTGNGTGNICANDANPQPHLIFKIYPLSEQTMAMGRSMKMNNDESCRKNHASNVFELIRQSVQVNGIESSPCPLNIGLYHDEDPMRFDHGDTGLTPAELGVPADSHHFTVHDTKLPSCSGGGVPVSPPPPGGD